MKKKNRNIIVAGLITAFAGIGAYLLFGPKNVYGGAVMFTLSGPLSGILSNTLTVVVTVNGVPYTLVGGGPGGQPTRIPITTADPVTVVAPASAGSPSTSFNSWHLQYDPTVNITYTTPTSTITVPQGTTNTMIVLVYN